MQPLLATEPPKSDPAAEPARPPLLAAAKEAAPHPVQVIVVYLFAVFAGAALAAPRFYASAEFLAEHHSAWRKLTEIPFHRYVGRALLLFALIGLPVFLKKLRIPSAKAIGLSFRGHGAEFIQGLVWGFAALALVAALALGAGTRVFNPEHTVPEIFRHVRNTVLVAMIVAALEEVLFRGALFGALRRCYAYWPAAILGSAFFAILHFFQQPESPESIQWYSGFVTLAQMFRGFVDVRSLMPGFLNLFLIGIMLTLTVERTRSLLFAIGLHAGLIFWVKTFGFTTKPLESGDSWVWGSSKLVDGWASCVVLGALLITLHAVLPRVEKNA